MAGASHSALQMTYGSNYVVSFGTLQTDDVSRSTYTFTIPVGAANATKRCFYIAHWSEGGFHRAISASSVDGVASEGTDNSQEGHSGGLTGFGTSISSVAIPTSSGDVTLSITLSGNASGMSIFPIIVYNLENDAPSDTDFDEAAGTATDLSGSINMPEGGLVFLAYTGSTNTNATAVGLTGLTEVYDQTGPTDPGDGLPVRIAFGYALRQTADATFSLVVDLASNVGDAGNAYVAQTWV
jgi:hypothetical protein